MISPPLSGEIRFAQYLFFCVLCFLLFSPFANVWSALRYKASIEPFGIFNHCLQTKS